MNRTNNNEAYSFHPDGMQVNMADGSTHFLTEQIDPDLYCSMVTIANHEIIQEF